MFNSAGLSRAAGARSAERTAIFAGRLSVSMLFAFVAIAAAFVSPVSAHALQVVQAGASTQPGAASAAKTPAVIDYSSGFSASTPSTLKSARVGVVLRYVGSSSWKSLTRAEADALRGNGIDIGAVYESSAGWMLGGRAAGVAAAKAARDAIVSAGGPSTPFVYMACDIDTRDFAAVNAALQGAQSVLGAQNVGIYGSYYVCQSALQTGSATKAWQTVAWSDGQVLPNATLLQLVPQTLGDLGVDYDTNLRFAEDVGQWGRSASTSAAPTGTVAIVNVLNLTPQPAPTTSSLRAIESTDGAKAWAVGDNGTIARTESAGATWTVQSAPTTASLDAVHFVDAANGWVAGQNGKVFHTTNGGKSWNAQSTPTTATIKALAFADAWNGWLAGERGTILRTTDGGVTWTAQSSRTTDTVSALQFSSATTGTAVTGAGRVLFTGDGGATWFSQSTSTTSALSSLQLVGRNAGWASGANGTVLFTGDGGSTYARQQVPTRSDLSAVRFADSTTGVAVGTTGTVLFTRDGGSTWDLQPMQSMTNLNAIALTGKGGWIVGDGGTILRITIGPRP